MVKQKLDVILSIVFLMWSQSDKVDLTGGATPPYFIKGVKLWQRNGNKQNQKSYTQNN